jgi:predicted nucleic acid-binding protein
VARPEIPDTSALLDVVRRPEHWPALQRSLLTGQVWLSTVVVAELYAGTRGPEDAQLLDRIVAAMQRVDRSHPPRETGRGPAGSSRAVSDCTAISGLAITWLMC